MHNKEEEGNPNKNYNIGDRDEHSDQGDQDEKYYPYPPVN